LNEEVVGAFTAVSTIENAFSEEDVSFIKMVGAVLDVLLALEHDATRPQGD
jgi:hypothetical protein